MTITEQQAAHRVLQIARGEVGYMSGNSLWSKYGLARNWRSPWRGGATEWQGYWCARFLAWAFDRAFTAGEAALAMGNQPFCPLPLGWAATWLWRDWFRANNLHVGWANARPGDIVFFRFPNPSGGRSANPTNHVGMVVERRPGNALLTVEGNTPKPGTGYGDGGSTAGVWHHVRYLDSTIVAVYRPNWRALVKALNAAATPTLTSRQKTLLAELELPDTPAGIKQFQAFAGITVDGIPGPITTAALEDIVSTIIERLDALTSEVRGLREQVGPVSRIDSRVERIHERSAHIARRVDQQAADQRQTMIALTRGNRVGDQTLVDVKALQDAVAAHDAAEKEV